MHFHGNQLWWAIKRPYISLCFKYHTPSLISFSTMLAPRYLKYRRDLLYIPENHFLQFQLKIPGYTKVFCLLRMIQKPGRINSIRLEPGYADCFEVILIWFQLQQLWTQNSEPLTEDDDSRRRKNHELETTWTNIVLTMMPRLRYVVQGRPRRSTNLI